MNATGRILIVAFAMVLIDLPWLSLIGGNYNAIVQAIQGGREVRMRPLAGIVVYPAMAWLSLRTTSLRDAFLTGLAVYAVYDFTVLAVFKDYPLYMAVADSLWGGILFTVVFWLRQRFGF
jgi:uncharacterized membrane protein